MLRLLQLDKKRRALAQFPIRPHSAAEAFHYPAHRRQADAGALEFRVGMQALEHAEQLADVAHVEAGAVVAHAQDHRAGVGGACADFDDGLLDLGGELDGIGEQVDQHQAQEAGVGEHRGEFGDAPFDVARGHVAQAFLAGFADHLHGVDGLDLHFHAAGARQVEQVVDQQAHAAGGLADAVQVVAAFAGHGTAFADQDLREGADVAHRGAQVVRDRVAEGFELLVDGFQLRGAV